MSRRKREITEARRAYIKAWKAANRDKVRAQEQRFRAKHKNSLAAKTRARYALDPELHKERVRKYRAQNREKTLALYKKYRQENKAKRAYWEMQRQARKLQAMPKWVNKEEIKQIYLNCPEGHHVDHIHPLRGKNFSGLHVPYNLQYLPAVENLKKSNKLWI